MDEFWGGGKIIGVYGFAFCLGEWEMGIGMTEGEVSGETGMGGNRWWEWVGMVEFWEGGMVLGVLGFGF